MGGEPGAYLAVVVVAVRQGVIANLNSSSLPLLYLSRTNSGRLVK